MCPVISTLPLCFSMFTSLCVCCSVNMPCRIDCTGLMKLLVLRVDAAFVLTDMHKLFFVCVVITRDESLTSYPADGHTG